MNNYNKVLEYRSHLMGIAILWVVFFHMQITLPIAGLEFIRKIGYGGVDIFFLLSGIGVYYSLKKNSIESFYRRRLKRIIPSYLPIVLVVFGLYNFQNYQGLSLGQILSWVKQLVGNVFMIGWFNQVEGQFNWYVQALIWFYLFTPILLFAIRKAASKKRNRIIFWLILIAIQVPFFGSSTLMMTVRLLIYTLGISIAFSHEEGNMKKINPVILYTLSIAGFGILYFIYFNKPDWLGTYGMYWFPFFLIVPGLSLLIVKGLDVVNRYRCTQWIVKSIKAIGEASFEIYLIHITLFDFIFKPIGVEGDIQWIIATILAVFAGSMYHKMILSVRRKNDK